MKQLYKVVAETYSGKRRVIRENMTREDAMAFCRSCGWEMRENGVIYSLTMEGETA